MPAPVEPDTDDAPLGTVSIGLDDVDSRSGDNAKSLHRDLVVHGASPGAPKHTSLGDTVLAPGFLGAIGPGVARLLLPSSPGSPSPPIN
jgi:hypothetical protein